MLPQVRLFLLHRRNNAGMSSLSAVTFTNGRTLQLLIVVLQRNTAEFAITVIALPVVLILLILAGVAVQREIKW
jgi:hypothetical protein